MSKPLETGSAPAPDSLIEYPCDFPIKVMGLHVEGLVDALTAIAQNWDAQFDPSQMEFRASKTGRYLSVTLLIHATHREQLDGLYLALTSHPWVKVVL